MQALDTKLNPKAIIFANVFFAASNSIFFKLSTVPPMVFVSTRFFLCALVFFGVLLIRKTVWNKAMFEISGRRFISLFLIGFVFSFGASAFSPQATKDVAINKLNKTFFILLFSLVSEFL